MHFPGSSGHFKSEFLVHLYTFYNFQIAITPKISQIDTWYKGHFWMTTDLACLLRQNYRQIKSYNQIGCDTILVRILVDYVDSATAGQ